MRLGKTTKNVLITRPEIMCHSTMTILTELGYNVFCHPLTKLIPIDYQLPSLINDFIIIATSPFALKSLKKADIKLLQKKRIFVVGDKTAEQAETLGFDKISTSLTSLEMVNKINKIIDKKNQVLYLAGKIRFDKFLSKLNKTHIILIETYDSIANKVKNCNLPIMDAILFYSLMATEGYLQLTPYINNKTKFFCLSERIYNNLPKKLQKNSFFPTIPTQEQLFLCLQYNL
ncbi:uroporphyrinogen-III synthase [Bartonella sp. DGB1]|uniref:uroporphyrinogen-III synthase n=1 Tax=Bartonella sp. DGB1 TaxID=3239807 RepID=UPI003525BD22